MSLRKLLAAFSLIALLPLALTAQTTGSEEPAPLAGEIQGNTYYSATGLFHMPIPVLEELGGGIKDSANLVSFADAFTTHITIAVFPLDDGQVKELATRGKKGYLTYFFTNFLLKDLVTNFPGSSAEAEAHYLGNVKGGSMLVFTLLPGGSMFNGRIAMFPGADNIPIAKRGNLAFVHGNNVIVISSELGERSTERSAWHKTREEENAMLRARLIKLADSMTLTTPSIAASPAATVPASPAPAPSAAPAK